MYHPAAPFADGGSQIGGGYGVERGGCLAVALSLVDRRISGTVDDAVDLVMGNEMLYGELIGDVELDDVGVHPCVLGMGSLQPLHLVSQLAVTAGNEYVHKS